MIVLIHGCALVGSVLHMYLSKCPLLQSHNTEDAFQISGNSSWSQDRELKV
jgi:hypothetical protein